MLVIDLQTTINKRWRDFEKLEEEIVDEELSTELHFLSSFF